MDHSDDTGSPRPAIPSEAHVGSHAVPPRTPFLWSLFLAAVLGPPLLTTLAAWMDHRGSAAPAITFLGSAVGAIVAGVLVGRRFGSTGAMKVLLSIVFSGLIAVALITLCSVGCAVAGYTVDFR